jgi:CHAD domain-containing protein
MTAKDKRTARDLVQPALDGLVSSVRAAADRMLAPRVDPEAVHDFRVALRRLRTVLRAARSVYGRKRVQPLLLRVAHLAEATNSLRDEEVLDETIAHVALSNGQRAGVTAWLERRALIESRLREAAIERLRGNDLEELCTELMKVLADAPHRDVAAERFARTKLNRARARVRDALPVDEDDVDGLHRLRILFKRLRYTAEMLGRFLTPEDAAAALRERDRTRPNYAAVARLSARMQKSLGSLHDVDHALQVVAVDEELAPDAREELLEGLSNLRDHLAQEAIARLEELPEEMFGRTVRD